MLVLAMTTALGAMSPSAQQRSTPDIHYVPTSGGVTDAMLKLANVTPADIVYDLGCGDGRPLAPA